MYLIYKGLTKVLSFEYKGSADVSRNKEELVGAIRREVLQPVRHVTQCAFI